MRLPDARSITGEAMGMAIDSIRARTDQEGNHCLEESSQDITTGVHPLAQAIAGGGVLDSPGGGKGATPATAAEQDVGICSGVLFGDSGGGAGNDGIAYDISALQEDVNQLEEDRKMRRRQVERTAARLSRVRQVWSGIAGPPACYQMPGMPFLLSLKPPSLVASVCGAQTKTSANRIPATPPNAYFFGTCATKSWSAGRRR